MKNPFPTFPATISGSHHRIPLITDKKNAGDVPKHANFFEQLPPSYPSSGGLDWSIIASCNPESIVESNDIPTIEAIIKSFLSSRFSSTELQILPNPLAAKFFRVMQIAVTYLVDIQKDLKKRIEGYETSNDSLKGKIKTVTEALTKLKAKTSISTFEKCVICRKQYQSIEFLDKHMARRHPSLVPAWNSLRTGKIQGLDDVNEKISQLKEALAKTKYELEKTKLTDNPNMSIITEKPDPHLRVLMELQEKQKMLIQETMNQERADLHFRREMRSQLDNAISALKSSQSQLKMKTLDLPPVSIPEQRVHELENSLTSQLVHEQLKNEIPSSSNIKSHDLEEVKSTAPIPVLITTNLSNRNEAVDIKAKRQKIEFNFDTAQPVISGRIEGAAPYNPPEIMNQQKSDPTPIVDYHSSVIVGDDYWNEGNHLLSTQKSKTQLPKVALSLEELIKKANSILCNDIPEDPKKRKRISKITQTILTDVDERLDMIKQMRLYAPLIQSFAFQVLHVESKEYEENYKSFYEMINQEYPIPRINKDDLFKIRSQKWNINNPIPQTQNLKAPPPPINNKQDFQPKPPLPSISPKKTTFLLPESSELETVSRFSDHPSESSSTIGFSESPYLYVKTIKDPQVGISHIEEQELIFNLSQFDSVSESSESELQEIKPIERKEFESVSDSDSDGVSKMVATTLRSSTVEITQKSIISDESFSSNKG